MLEAVPEEVRTCPQWLVWRLHYNEARNKWDKQPISANSGLLCDVTKPENWSSLPHCLHILDRHRTTHHLGGCGFVLGHASECVGVDFDGVLHSDRSIASERLLRMADLFQSYTEVSPSGTGLHVLTRGRFDGGRRHDGVEIYGQGRFFTVTGDCYGAPRRFTAQQDKIEQLVKEIDEGRAVNALAPLDWHREPTMDDYNLYHMALSAVNGQKFHDLWDGRWELHFPSQSEADTALVNILGFYSDAPTQIARMFRMSGLGRRNKADRPDYLNKMIQLSQDRKPPLVQIPVLPKQALVVQPPAQDEDYEEKMARDDDPFQAPEGFVKDLAEWFYAQSVYPMKELAVVAALGVMAGIVGRQYQFQRGGLNLYLMLLAKTGMGKEALSAGVSRIFDAVCSAPPAYDNQPSVNIGFPAARSFQGPQQLSGKGLLRKFADSASLSMVSVSPEFSQTMSSMANQNAHQGLRDFQAALLDFYTKSAEGTSYQGAMNADSAKDIKPLAAPAFTLLCEGTPERFYNSLSDVMVTDGLLSRFIIIEREVEPDYNPSFEQFTTVPEHIKTNVAAMCQHVLMLRHNGDHRIHVTMTTDGSDYSEMLRARYRKRGIDGSNEISRFLWLRAHQNLCRMAALVAVGTSLYQPVVTVDMLAWANRIIYKQVLMIIGKFKRGEVGKMETDEADQYAYLLGVIEKWRTVNPHNIKMQKLWIEAQESGVIPYSYIQQKTVHYAAFRKDKRGASSALKINISTAEANGVLSRVRFGNSDGLFYRVSL